MCLIFEHFTAFFYMLLLNRQLRKVLVCARVSV